MEQDITGKYDRFEMKYDMKYYWKGSNVKFYAPENRHSKSFYFLTLHRGQLL